jgi:hypothetical protein
VRLRNLTTSLEWQVFVKYLGSIKEAAGKNLRRTSNTLQLYGYFSGVIQVVEDLENLPADILAIIQKERSAGNEE